MSFNRDGMFEDAVLSGRRFRKTEKRSAQARRREQEEFFSEIESEDFMIEDDLPTEL